MIYIEMSRLLFEIPSSVITTSKKGEAGNSTWISVQEKTEKGEFKNFLNL
jgi:hypothetical protein